MQKMSYYPKFAELLNHYLEGEERSASWLAKRLEMAPYTVSRWLNKATRPGSPETVIRIADLLGIHEPKERQAFLHAAGYGYLEGEPAPFIEEASPEKPVSLQTWQYYASGIVCAVSLSADGQIVVAGSSSKTVLCLNEAGKEQWQKKVGNEAWRTALSADGQIMIVGTGSTRFWDQGRLGLFCFAKDGSLRWYQKLAASVWGLSISADGSTIAVGTSGNQLLLFDNEGHPLWNRDVPAIAWYGWVWSAALSADGTLIIAGGADKRIRLLDRSGRLLAEHQAQGEVLTVTASADGTVAAAGDNKCFIYFFNQHGEFLWQKELPHKVWDLKLRDDGQQLFVGSADKQGHLTVYDQTGQLLWRRFVETGVSCLDVNTDGQRIAVGTYKGAIYIFDSAGNLQHQAQAGKQIRDIALSATGETVIAGSEDGLLYGFILPY